MTRVLDLGTPGGLRVAVKECLAIAGLPIRAGSAAFENAPPALTHADVVQSVLKAGCHVIGQANMHELAFGMTGANAHTGTPENPLWPDRIPGGSSSGCAALVASGAVDFAIGTDTGGSVRQPACCCGTYGLKPTYGRISRAGALPVASSIDCIGPLAASAPMLTRAMAAMDPGFAPVPCPGTPRIARVTGFDASPEVSAAFETAAARLSPARTVTLPGLEAAFAAGMTIMNAEMAAELGALALSDASLGADVRGRILKARTTTAAQIAEAEAIRTAFTAETDAALEGVDALLLPTLPQVPPTWQEAQDPMNVLPLTRFVRPFNLSGHPALTLPIRTAAGLPAGLQLVGARGSDALLCALAEWIALRLTEKETA
ncbi:amidase [Pseudooceanicola sp. CBS1P-1]|uniref:Amidase n=2 Tax=Paracoccaceae TaxID=31989 RepID=A0A6L7G8F7_9RHOB|nr:amidase [Pseudooceanicola endophyticus]MXN20524.1 amidase [Pseudooceanicola albus]